VCGRVCLRCAHAPAYALQAWMPMEVLAPRHRVIVLRSCAPCPHNHKLQGAKKPSVRVRASTGSVAPAGGGAAGSGRGSAKASSQRTSMVGVPAGCWHCEPGVIVALLKTAAAAAVANAPVLCMSQQGSVMPGTAAVAAGGGAKRGRPSGRAGSVKAAASAAAAPGAAPEDQGAPEEAHAEQPAAVAGGTAADGSGGRQPLTPVANATGQVAMAGRAATAAQRGASNVTGAVAAGKSFSAASPSGASCC
jgi:hypothetical protein